MRKGKPTSSDSDSEQSGDTSHSESTQGTPVAVPIRENHANTSIAPHHLDGAEFGECTPCEQTVIIAMSCLIVFFPRPGPRLDDIVSPDDIGVIKFKKDFCGNLFTWYRPLPSDPRHIHVGQLKQMIQMLPVLAIVPGPCDTNFIARDSLMKRIHDVAVEQGYTVHKKDAPDSSLHINKGNTVTKPTLKYVAAVVETLSLQFLLNNRGPFSKSKKFTPQSPEVTASLAAIQDGLKDYIASINPSLLELLPTQMCINIEQIFNKRIRVNNLIKIGVYTGWADFQNHPGGLWVGQWFLWTFLTDEHRFTVDKFGHAQSLKGNHEESGLPLLPNVLNPDANPPLFDFIRHVCRRGRLTEIQEPLRQNALVWRGNPVDPPGAEGCETCFAEM